MFVCAPHQRTRVPPADSSSVASEPLHDPEHLRAGEFKVTVPDGTAWSIRSSPQPGFLKVRVSCRGRGAIKEGAWKELYLVVLEEAEL